MAGYQKEILPSSMVAYSKIYCYNINSEEKEGLGANIKKKWEATRRPTRWHLFRHVGYLRPAIKVFFYWARISTVSIQVTCKNDGQQYCKCEIFCANKRGRCHRYKLLHHTECTVGSYTGRRRLGPREFGGNPAGMETVVVDCPEIQKKRGNEVEFYS